MPSRWKRRRFARKSSTSRGPARAPVDQAPHRITGGTDVPGFTPYPAEWESELERSLIYLTLMCHDIRTIEAQPMILTYEDDDGEHEYTPDLALTLDRGRIFVENKSLKFLVQPDNLRKYLAIARSLRARGQELTFITEDQLPKVWVRNASFLRQYLVPEHLIELPACVIEALRGGPRTIEAVLVATSSTVTLAEMYSYIAHRRLCIDWSDRLGRGAHVSLPDQPNSFARLTYGAIQNTGRFADLVAEMALGHRPTDQRLLAAACARRRPLSVASPRGFVDGFTGWELGHLERQRAARFGADVHDTVAGNGVGNRAQPQSTEER